MHLIGVELAELDELFDFGDDVIGGRCHHGIKVARGLAIGKVAPAVALPCFDEREVAAQTALHHVHAAIKFARLLPLGNHGAVASGRIKRWNSGASRTQALAQRALWIQFHLQFSTKDELLEEFVFTHVGGNHLIDLVLLE